jgi:hypothetical protein
MILEEAYDGIVGGHYTSKAMTQIFYARGFGGLHYTKMQSSIVRPETCVKEWENCLGETKCR